MSKFEGDKCPKCGNEWNADNALIDVRNYRKHFWDFSRNVSFHEAYPDVPRFHCISCDHRWGTWDNKPSNANLSIKEKGNE